MSQTPLPPTGENLRWARLTYICFWTITILFALLSECNVLPTGYVQADAQTSYALNMLCVLLTLGGSWGALRLFALKGVKERISRKPHQVPQWNMLRTCILGFCILLNAIVYFALLSDTTPLYCLLITLTAFIFCWPKQDEVVKENNEKN